MPFSRFATLLLAAAIGAACSGESSGDDASASTCFLAFDAAYAGFRSWSSHTFDVGVAGDAGLHVGGPRTEYVNRLPPAGSTSFPIGTVIVKEVGAGDPANHRLFAMVKRGCNFNASGATGWEFMEIREASTGAGIVWRGVGPPAGENYGGDPNGCNACHGACRDNDSVCSAHLRLSTF